MISGTESIAALVLAAGGSRRLGRSKQLLQYQGQSLIRHTVKNALQSKCESVLVALGSDMEVCAAEINDLPVEIVTVNNWREGISASIIAGVSHAIALPGITGLLVVLCDQPLVNSLSLNSLIAEFESAEESIVASKYNGVLGAPVLFGRELFEELKTLTGDIGAREIILSGKHRVRDVLMPEAASDIDTEADLRSSIQDPG